MTKEPLTIENLFKHVTEEEIISHYIPDFNGAKKLCFNPLSPDEKKESLSIFPHKDGKGWRLSPKNTGQPTGDIFQFVGYLKNLDSKTQLPAIIEAIAADMHLDLSKPAAAVKWMPAATIEKPKATTPAGKNLFEIEILPEFTEDFLAYWRQWSVTPETLKAYNVQQVSSNKNKKGDTITYTGRKAALFTVAGWEKIIVPPAKPEDKKGVFQNTGPAPYLFGLDQAQQSPADTLIICEGEKDLLVLAQNGFAGITLQSAAARLTPEQAEVLKTTAGNRAAFVIYDNDEAGRKGAAANAALSGFPVATLPEAYNDIADFFAAGHTSEELRAILIGVGNKPAKEEKPEGSAKETPAADIALLYEVQKDREGNSTGIKLKTNKILEQIKIFGYGRYDSAEGPKLIHKRDNVIKPVTSVEIADTFFKWLKAGPDTVNGYSLEKIINKFLDGSDTYFSEKRLYRLEAEEINFCTDTQKETFFFFENGFVICTANGWKLYPYSELKGSIWESQIISRKQENNRTIPGRNVTVLEPTAEPWKRGIVAKFLFNLCGQNTGRFLEFSTIIGYLLHNYFEGRRFAVLLTDSSLENGDNGRTGKSLLSNLLGYLKPTTSIDGKIFKADNKFNFQEVKPGTQIVVINDLAKGFELENIYNAITEVVTVDKKNQTPFSQQVKFLLTTNAPIKVDGASGRDRIAELEVSDHYSDTHSVTDDFPNKWFLSSNIEKFSPDDWDEYFNLFFCCCSNYLNFGVLKPDEINLKRRKLKQQTPDGFPEWMDEQIGQGKIKIGEWENCGNIHLRFLETFPDYKANRKWNQVRYFKGALEDYVSLSGQFKQLKDEENMKRRVGVWYMVFDPK